MKSSINRKLWRGHSLKARVAVAAIAAVSVAGTSALGVSTAAAKSKGAPLVVWYDSSRAAYKAAYMAANPGANIKWVLYNGNANGTGVLQSKFALWNRTGWPSSAPDVMFDTQNYDAIQLATAPYNDLLNLKKYVPASVFSKYAGNSEAAACGYQGGYYCLRNDNAADLLWVNQTLWNQFFPGQTPPTSWQQLLTDSQTLQASHPGYLTGDVGDNFDEDFILWGNQCQLNQVTKAKTVAINPLSSNCTGIANAIDGAHVIGKSWSQLSLFSSSFPDDHVVMIDAPLWFGGCLTAPGCGEKNPVPSGTMVASPPLTSISGAKTTGALGGGLWLVSKHSKNPKAAAAFAQFMSTSPKIQGTSKVEGGLPDYTPDQSAYLATLGSVYGNPTLTASSFQTAAAEIWNGWSPVPWSTDGIWGANVTPNLTSASPSTFGSQLEPYAEDLANYARQAGYSVQSSDKNVSLG